jgi:hypothetical protein
MFPASQFPALGRALVPWNVCWVRGVSTGNLRKFELGVILGLLGKGDPLALDLAHVPSDSFPSTSARCCRFDPVLGNQSFAVAHSLELPRHGFGSWEGRLFLRAPSPGTIARSALRKQQRPIFRTGHRRPTRVFARRAPGSASRTLPRGRLSPGGMRERICSV